MNEIARNIEQDMSEMAFRVPVVAGEMSKDERSAVNHRWSIVTEVARQAIMDNADVASQAADFIIQDLDEQLPNNFVNDISSVEPRVKKAVNTVGKRFEEWLQLPSVPEELISYGIRQSGQYYSPENARQELTEAATSYGEIYDSVLQEVHMKAARNFLTAAEVDLVADRYRQARDVKLLALMAALKREQPEKVIKDGLVHLETKSGVKMTLTSSALEADPNLTDPTKWKGRTQIKDRVYEVVIGDKRYIMKEEKTSRHTDVFEGNETTGGSEHEFKVGQVMTDRTFISDDLQITWERPIGFVTYPDGYQFCMFEKVPNALDYKLSSIGAIEHEIESRPTVYAEEYAAIRQETARFIAAHHDQIRSLKAGEELTFSQFAAAKVEALTDQGERDVEKEILRAGYVDRDHKGFVIMTPATQSKEGRTTLQLVGIDYEFFTSDKIKSDETLEKLHAEEADGSVFDKMLTSRRHEDGMYDLKPEDIARLILCKKLGWNLPNELA